ncbi:mechanosensitive ion channel family protein [Halobacteria archaeon AArc-m2/3/4]|uniref:Mechanosensitive ion channel family protein n=1 Tax=Natronoglomus mannanivorans TaxID=2979990 RepID=A0ABT2QKY6_9EURY|nr:mechanosensitive ion channel family protein [Halobacteria archaeon AArc-m2/3/4]
MLTSPDFLLQSPLRPDPIPWIQETYLSSLESQLLATGLLVVVALLATVGIRRSVPSVRRRYGPQIAEASAVAGLLVVVLGSIYAFSVIWHVTFVLRRTLAAMAFDRWIVTLNLVTITIAVVAYLCIRFVNRSIDKLAETRALTNHQSEVAYHVADVAIVGSAATLALTLWGIDLTNIFIGAGAITAIVALTARETLTSMLAGFILLFSRPFRVGDWIEVNDRSGIVKDVTIFNTKIQTFGDKHVLIPNDEITSSQLTNFSRNDQLRVEIEIGVDYETDLEYARDVIVDAVCDLESIKRTPNPQVVAKRFGDSAVLLELQLWIGDPTKRRTWDARTDAIEAVMAAFDREGISIPYPHRVHSPRDDDGYPIRGMERDEMGLTAPQD